MLNNYDIQTIGNYAATLKTHPLDKHLCFQRYGIDGIFDPDCTEYKGYLIKPEFPNGGMIAISVMEIKTRKWWSLPCGVEDVVPFFGYFDDEKAIAWIKSLIDEFANTPIPAQ